MKIIKSKIIPLKKSDIDTDLIIPAEFLTVTDKKGLGRHLFDRLRKMDPKFPFNLPQYSDAKILVTRENFGCGSSREHAAWALRDWGIEVIIAPTFSDIFYNNALKNGILPIRVSSNIVEEIFAEGSVRVEVNLPKQNICFERKEIHFDLDPYRKECLLRNMDDLDYLLAELPEIRAYDARHHEKIFFDISKL